MKHTLKGSVMIDSSISIEEFQDKVIVIIENNNTSERIPLTKKELHSLIGTLLHVQAKMKGGNNG